MAANRKALWLGYLQAGDKGSPVVRAADLDTGNPATIYLFNLKKGRFIEYRRDIVEGKLCELPTDDESLAGTLRKAYKQARLGFTPRAAQRIVTTVQSRRKPPDPEEPDDVEEIDFGDDLPPLDDDWGDPAPAELGD